MSSSIFGAANDIYFGIGPFFCFAFGIIMVSFVILVMMFREEHRKLFVSDEYLQSLLIQIETHGSRLHRLLIHKARGQDGGCHQEVEDANDCLCPRDEEEFGVWVDAQVLETEMAESSQERLPVKKYLFGVLSSPRPFITMDDNRLKLTALKDFLKQRSYHRFINLVLATTSVSLGVLGTVTGLWMAFNNADFQNIQAIATVMDDIMKALAQALYTTGIGLLLSMPMILVAFHMEARMEKVFTGVQLVRDAVMATIASSGRIEPSISVRPIALIERKVNPS